MSGAYEIFHVSDEATVDMALELVERVHGDCHPWLPDEARAEYLLRFGLCYIVFMDDEYRGFFAIMTDEDGAFLHFGTTGGRYAIKDVLWTLSRERRTYTALQSYSVRLTKVLTSPSLSTS
jgi:hypothetical protein